MGIISIIKESIYVYGKWNKTTDNGYNFPSLSNPTSQRSGVGFPAGLGNKRQPTWAPASHTGSCAQPGVPTSLWSFWVVLTLSLEMRTTQLAVSASLRAPLLLPRLCFAGRGVVSVRGSVTKRLRETGSASAHLMPGSAQWCRVVGLGVPSSWPTSEFPNLSEPQFSRI